MGMFPAVFARAEGAFLSLDTVQYHLATTLTVQSDFGLHYCE